MLSLDDTDWKMSANFGVASSTDWRFNASVHETGIAQDEALIGDLISRLCSPIASNLVFSGKFSLDAEGECTPQLPVPVWSAKGVVKDVDATYSSDGQDVEVGNLSLRFGLNGIADRKEISPMYPRADRVSVCGVVLSNVFASVRATERSYLVTEAGARCCGGELKLYSLFLDPEKLSAGATIFVDGVDAGQVLSHVSGFNGYASGRLHGKLPFFLKDGRKLHFRDAYLFSTPGEVGKVMISDAKPLLDNLSAAGVSSDDCDNLAKALANLDYRVLRIELRKEEDGEGFAVPLRLEGTSTHGNTTVPVDINVTFRGDLDKLVNTGMGLSRRK